MSKRKYDIILFDMDGTIVDSDLMIIKSICKLYDKYRNGYRPSIDYMRSFSGPPIKDTLKNEFPLQDPNKLVDEYHDISLTYYETDVKAFPHVKDVLIDLKNNGFVLGVVTNKVHSLTELSLKVNSLDGLFSIVVGWDDVLCFKPNPKGIDFAFERLNGIDKKRVLYVGDNDIDITTGLNALVDTCLVQFTKRDISLLNKATYHIKSFLKLKECLYD